MHILLIERTVSFLKLNKEKMRELASLSDEELWTEIRTAAQKFGYTLPQNPPKDIEKIRSAMSEAERLSPMDLARLMSSFKEKGRKG